MRVKRFVLLVLGFVAIGVGAVGVFVPVLPTTPFVLVAAACFGASSPRLYGRLARSPFFGDYIRSIRDRKPLPARTRVLGIAALWALLAISMAVVHRTHAAVVNETQVTVILLIVGVCVTVHLLTIRRGR
jgi:uncharacterized membrane protein YbaN (DUF454 family)